MPTDPAHRPNFAIATHGRAWVRRRPWGMSCALVLCLAPALGTALAFQAVCAQAVQPVAAIAPQAVRTASATAPRPSWLVLLSAMHKAPAADPLPPSLPQIALSAARGECEGFQIALTPGMRLSAVARPHLPEGIALALYRIGFVDIRVPSNGEGRTGRWPDPLIPERDPATGNSIAAFFRPARNGEPTLLYVELCTSPKARSGRQKLWIDLDVLRPDKTADRFTLPIELSIHGFELPATATLTTSFGFSAISAARQHGLLGNPPARDVLTRLYASSALRHRLSLHGLSMEPPAIRARDPLRLDFSAHDAEVSALLDGRSLASDARATSIDVRPHPALRGDERAEREYFRLYEAHLRDRGWLDRAFFYVADEPTPAQLPEVAARARLVRASAPGIRVLVTHGIDPLLDGAIDIWTPNLNCLFQRPGGDYCASILTASRYAALRQAGARLWWYQSCGSHGCVAQAQLTEAQRAYFTGWPSYMIDHDAALNRAMGALAFVHGIDGELYFNTVEAWNPPPSGGEADPWQDVLRFHGNGDGTLFYPGTPERLGSTSHLPIESLRLKHLRDGLEDFEYLALARALGQETAAIAFAQAVVPLPWQIERSPERWAKARQALARAIEAKWGAH